MQNICLYEILLFVIAIRFNNRCCLWIHFQIIRYRIWFVLSSICWYSFFTSLFPTPFLITLYISLNSVNSVDASINVNKLDDCSYFTTNIIYSTKLLNHKISCTKIITCFQLCLIRTRLPKFLIVFVAN